MAWILFCENKIKQAHIYSRMHYYHITNSRSTVVIVVYKVKVHPRTGHEGPKGEKYSSAFSLTSALNGVGGQRHAPASLPSCKTWYPLCKTISGRVRSLAPTRIRYADRPACSESPYRMNNPGPQLSVTCKQNTVNTDLASMTDF